MPSVLDELGTLWPVCNALPILLGSICDHNRLCCLNVQITVQTHTPSLNYIQLEVERQAGMRASRLMAAIASHVATLEPLSAGCSGMMPLFTTQVPESRSNLVYSYKVILSTLRRLDADC